MKNIRALIAVVVISTLSVPAVSLEDEHWTSRPFQPQAQYSQAMFFRPIPNTRVETPRSPTLPTIEAVAPPVHVEKPSSTYLGTFLNAVKAPFLGVGAVLKATLNLPIIKPIQEGIRMVVGYTLSLVSGDLFKSKPEAYKVKFDPKGPALVTVNGVRNGVDEAATLKMMAQEAVGVNESTMIQNHSFLFGIGDLIQSAKYEYLNAIDQPVVDTYRAIKQGLEERGYVVTVAHSQGTAVVNQAYELLTNEEKERVARFGFGNQWNGSGKGAVNIHNPGDPIPWLQNLKVFTNMMLPWNWGRNTATITAGDGRGHSMREYQSSLGKAVSYYKQENPWESYLRP